MPQQLEIYSLTVQSAFVHSMGLKSLPLHAGQIVTAAFIYFAIQNILSPFISTILFPQQYPKFDRRTKVLWNVGVVKMIKAPLNCFMCLVAMVKGMKTAHAITMEGRVWGYWSRGSSVQAIATGFYVFEILISIQYFDVLGLRTFLHAVASSSCSLLAFRPVLNYYGCRLTLLELPVFPEILRWCLHKLGKSDTSLYQINHKAMMALFAFSKLWWTPYQLT
jgi:hypothetical protein